MTVDAVDVLILALRILLVVCLYGFLIVVVRLASRSLRTSPSGPPAALVAEPRASEGSRALLRLVVVEPARSGLKAGQTFEIRERAVLGRAQAADVTLSDGSVSAEHARVQRAGRSWVVSDLGSTNGTRLNGAAVPANGQVALAAGDVLTLGTVHLRVAAR